jgi:hypothetical protein
VSIVRTLLCTLVLVTAAPAGAHRLDEYLQATTIALEKTRVEADIRLVPGVDVFPLVFAEIDRDADGVVSSAEQRAYAQRVCDDLSLKVDGIPMTLRLVSSAISPKVLLQDGRGEIRVQVEADVPGSAARRRLDFENRHQTRIGAYLVNVLVPADPEMQVTAQHRNYDQSSFQLDYTDASALSFASWVEAWSWIDIALAVLTLGLIVSAWRVTAKARRSHHERLGAPSVGDHP